MGIAENVLDVRVMTLIQMSRSQINSPAEAYTDRQLAIENGLVSLAYSSLGFSLFLQKYFKFVYGVLSSYLSSCGLVDWTTGVTLRI